MHSLITILPRRPTPAWRCTVAVLLSAAVAACSAWAGGAPLDRIDALIGAAACNTDAQCRVAAIGHRSCGGPESFRAWSTRDTQPALLDAALQAFADERRHQQQKSGEMSTCQMLPLPAAACMPAAAGAGAGRCVLSANSGQR